MKFSIKDFFSKCDKICRKLWIWSHLLKKSLMENSFFVQWIMSEAMRNFFKNDSAIKYLLFNVKVT